MLLNDVPLYLVRETNNAYTVQANASGNWSLTANLGLEEGNRVYVRARTASTYYGQSDPTTIVTTCQSESPVITGDYCGTTTTVSGSSTEPAGTTIQIYAGGEAVGGPGQVNENGFWRVTGLEIPAGTAITATATAPGSDESEPSEPVTATAQTSNEALTITGPILEGASTITGTGTGGAQLTLYIGGTPFTPIVIPPDGNWSLTGFSSSELFPGAEITATETATGLCESEPIESLFVECNPLTTTFTVSSDSENVLCGGSGTVTVSLGGSETGVAYTIVLPDGTTSGSSVMGTGSPITLTSGPIPNVTTTSQDVELSIRARRVTGSLGDELPESCSANLNETITRTILPQPPTNYTLTPLSSSICAGSTVSVQLANSVEGFTYQFINEATEDLVGSPIAGTGNPITLSTGVITANATYGVVITNNANDCVYVDAGRFNATVSGPAIDRPFFTPTTAVCVGGPATIFLATQNNSTYRYNVYRIAPNGAETQIGTNIVGTGDVVPVSTGTLNQAGTYTFYARVIGGNCLTPVELLSRPTINVDNVDGVADAGGDRTVCGSETILTAAVLPDPGTGRWDFSGDSRGAIITNPTSPSTTVTGLTTGTYTITWTVTTSCGGTTSDPAVDQIILTVNCPSTYVIAPPKYRDDYIPNDILATAVDTDGGIINAVLLSGTFPPGAVLDADNGNIYVGENPEALVTGIYTFTVRLTDAVGSVTEVSLTLEILEDSPVIIPLPVELVYFTATVRNNQAHLEWLTASELDNDRFEIERSLNARSFEKVGTVKGKGTTSLETKYQYTDRTPVQGTVYYRLKQVDLDGQFAYSNVIAVNAKGLARELATQAYPNPFQDVIKVTLTVPEAQVAVMTIFDINGRRVITKDLDLDAGVNVLELQLGQLQTGMYILKVVGEGMESTTRIMKN
ncbi:T9SS type A sorting domain-containing protein [Pontibacter virosus]|uniref:T9SS type A sorting domain-containing protein n=1 Tax=Pontibacter virosus TaxID=1765052 RepID=UPI001FAE7820|nr:T9SS type A sorting domain-containing protein [Pontibacter virosus]